VKTATMRRLTFVLPILSVMASASTVGYEYHRRDSLKRELARSENHTTQVAKLLAPNFKRPKDPDGDEHSTK